MDKLYKSAKQILFLTRMQNTQNGQENGTGTGINQKIRELGETVKSFNYTATSLSDMLRSAVPAPFHPDPVLTVAITLEDPIPLDTRVAVEFFNKVFMEISGVKIEGQAIVFFFNSEDGEDSAMYRVMLYDSIQTIELWERYLLELVADSLIPVINEARESTERFLQVLQNFKD